MIHWHSKSIQKYPQSTPLGMSYQRNHWGAPLHGGPTGRQRGTQLFDQELLSITAGITTVSVIMVHVQAMDTHCCHIAETIKFTPISLQQSLMTLYKHILTKSYYPRNISEWQSHCQLIDAVLLCCCEQLIDHQPFDATKFCGNGLQISMNQGPFQSLVCL